VGVAATGVAEGLAVACEVACAAPHAVVRTATNPNGADHLTERDRGLERIESILDLHIIATTGCCTS
jgi:hypothetical protein